MSDVERALRDLLTDDRLDLPVRPEAVAALHLGVHRRRRRRAAAVAVALTAVAVGGILGGVAVLAPAPVRTPPLHQTGQLAFDVPWADLAPPAPWVAPTLAPRPPSMTSPPCRADQLQPAPAQQTSTGGITYVTIPLRNAGGTRCRLVGRPPRVAAEQPGRADVVATNGLSLASGGVGGDLRPGHLGYLTLQTAQRCPTRRAASAPAEYHRLAVTLPSGTLLALRQPLDVTCGLRSGGLGVVVPPGRPAPDPRAALRPSLLLPSTVPAGTTLDYVVTLTNPSARAIALHDPSYVEAATLPGGRPVTASYGLNPTVRTIPAGESIRYEMRLDIPAGAPPGTLALRWRLAVASTGVVAGRVRVGR